MYFSSVGVGVRFRLKVIENILRPQRSVFELKKYLFNEKVVGNHLKIVSILLCHGKWRPGPRLFLGLVILMDDMTKHLP